jgi:tetratricopeptide (TPR) repeat protein
VPDVDGRCPACHETVPEEVLVCPHCGTGLRPTPRPVATIPPAAIAHHPLPTSALTSGDNATPLPPELARRFAKLQQWAEAVQPLGISLPVLPRWAEDTARRSSETERWSDVLRGVERLAHSKILVALEEWQKDVRTRLTRLEAYAVDSRLEREQMEDAIHLAKSGDISRALVAFEQVDRVVSLKERHLDTAREDLENVIALFRDMAALGLPIPQNPEELNRELERELRTGRLASLKQQLRALRTQALEGLKTQLPNFVGQYGDFLKDERRQGALVDDEVAELGRGARMFAQGRVEEALHRLRKLLQLHGSGSFRATRAKAPGGDRYASPTGSVQKA